MANASVSKVRRFRLVLWALLMLAACWITNAFNPYKVRYVPALFIPLIAPVVLLPWRRRRA